MSKRKRCGSDNNSGGIRCERPKGHKGFHWGEIPIHRAFWRSMDENVTARDEDQARKWLDRANAK